MRPVLTRFKRRASSAGPSAASRFKRSGRSTAPASGGPVAPEASFVSRSDRRISKAGRNSSAGFPRRRTHPVVRRVVLAVLICAAVGAMTISYRGGQPVLSGAQLAVLNTVAPIERGLSRAWDPIAGSWSWTGRLFSATSENPKLIQENAELRERLRISAEQTDELQRLRRAFHYDETARFPEGFKRVYARVSVRKPGATERSLTIDSGSRDGISVDDAVMVTGGLLGRVTAVKSRTSVVGLIIDDSQQVSAAVTGSDAWGVLRTVSTEGEPVLQLRYVDQADKVAVNDKIVTSGYSSSNGRLRAAYPGGIPIGFVSSVGNDKADVHKTVQVTPYVKFGRIDEVFVLVDETKATGA
ncbi:MAG: rod shape-determining protein MreC [Gaiellales bacterium]